LQACYAIMQLIRINRYFAIESSELFGLRTYGEEADFAFEHEPRAAANPQAMHLLDFVLPRAALAVRELGNQLAGDPAIAIDFCFEAERQQQELHLLE